MSDALNTDRKFLHGGGDMGSRMRDHDWSQSPLGQPETWPQSLRSVVSLMLHSRYPMFIAWGPELAFLYNDGYAPIFGAKHPHMLGRPFREAWSEIWDDIHPLIARALAGEATYDENLHLVMERNGYPEDTYYSFSYSPVYDDDSKIGGMFCACAETTRTVLSEKALLESEQRIRNVLENMGEAFALLDSEFRVLEMNAEALRMENRPLEDVIGKTHSEAHPNAAPELGEAYRRAVEDKVAAWLEHYYVWPDGRDAWIDMRAYPVGDNLAVFYRDVTTRKKAEIRRAAMVELGEHVRDLTDPDEIAFAAAEMLGKTLNVSRAGYGTIDKAAETVTIARDWNAPGIESLAGVLHFRDYGSYIDDLHKGITVAIADAEKDPRTIESAEALKAISAQSFVNMPVTEQGGMVALLYLNHETARIWTNEEIEFIREVAERTRTAVERRRSEAAWQESERRFQQIADSAPVPMWVTRLDRKRSFVNKAYLDFLAVDYDTALTFDWRTILHPDDHDRIVAESIAGEAALKPFVLEGRYRAGDGNWHWIRSQSQPRWGADGSHAGFIGVAHDITEAKNAEIALRESESRFRFLHRLAEIMQTEEEPEAVMAAATRLLGEHLVVDICAYADVEADGDTFHIRSDWTTENTSSIAGSYSLDDFGPVAAAAQRTGTPLIVNDALAELGEDQAFTAIGVAATICLPLVKHGRLAAMMAVHSAVPRQWTEAEVALVGDVSQRCWAHVERVGANAILRESERRFREQFENANDFIFTTDLEMRITSCNPAVAAALEQPPEQLIGRRISEFTPPETWELNKIMLADKLAGKGDNTRYEVEVFDCQGERMMWEINSRLMRDSSGKPTGLHAIGRDISERIRNQRLLEAARARAEADAAEQAAILGQLAEGVIITDASGKITFVNEAARGLHGVAALDVVPSEYTDTYQLFDEDGEPYPFEKLPLSRAVMHGETVRDARWKIRRPDGSEVVAIGNAQPVIGPEESAIGAVLTIRDDTARNAAEHALRELNDTLESRVAQRTAELEQAQEALRQSQKLEAMGQLTGGVAHDFNNLLTPILGSLDLLHRRQLGDERERKLIDGALQSAERAKLLVQRLLAFARRQPLKSVAVDIGQLIGGMAELVGSTCGPNVRVSVAIEDALPAAIADPNQLEMAILNLSVNARDAMPDGGRLTLSATSETVDGSTNLRLDPGHYIRISVADTGTGMDQSTIQRAVEPFFSTKGIGRGTGLGLSMVHGLASQLGGALTISSTPGLGTNVELWLPASASPVEIAADAQADAVAQVNAGKILLVDDELLVRTSTADMLTELGYEVVEASSAEAAIPIFAAGQFDLLVTDHLMPGMNGVDLVNALRDQRSDLPVLIVSGYADIDGIPPNLPRLTKPFRHADLAAAIATAVEPEPGVS